MTERLTSQSDACSVRAARADDCSVLLALIREFAGEIGLVDGVDASEDGLRESLFARRQASVLLGECAGEAAGYALFFQSYSTFQGTAALFLEDMYIRERYRKTGLGRAFFRAIAAEAERRGCPRVEWCCMDDNVNAIGFYRHIGARRLEGMGVYRIEGAPLAELARHAE